MWRHARRQQRLQQQQHQVVQQGGVQQVNQVSEVDHAHQPGHGWSGPRYPFPPPPRPQHLPMGGVQRHSEFRPNYQQAHRRHVQHQQPWRFRHHPHAHRPRQPHLGQGHHQARYVRNDHHIVNQSADADRHVAQCPSHQYQRQPQHRDCHHVHPEQQQSSPHPSQGDVPHPPHVDFHLEDAVHQLPHRPWVNYELRNEHNRLMDMIQRAKESKSQDDVGLMQQQRERVQRLEDTLKRVFFESHPHEESKWLPMLALEASKKEYWCELCDLSFTKSSLLKEHEEKEHEVCGLEGCNFVANKTVLEDHIIAVHASGLYARMNKEDSIEEIQKWRMERRSNWPSVSRINESMEKEKARLERQRLKSDRRRQEMNEREEFFKKQEEEKERLKSKTLGNLRNSAFIKNDEDEKKNVERRHQEGPRRQRRRNNKTSRREAVLKKYEDEDDPLLNVPMFTGLKETGKDSCAPKSDNNRSLYLEDNRRELELLWNDDEEDDGPPEEVSIVRQNGASHEQKVILNSLNSHEGSINEETNLDSQECRVGSSKAEEKINTSMQLSWRDLIEKRTECEETKDKETDLIRTQDRKRSWNGKSKAHSGDFRLNSFPKSGGMGSKQTRVWNPSEPFVGKIPRRSSKAKNVLLENLLAKDIEKERSQLLQCIKYVVAKNFFHKSK